MKAGDKVRYAGEANSVLCEVLEVKDMGHGEGYERVRIQLPPEYLGLTRYYAANELVEE